MEYVSTVVPGVTTPPTTVAAGTVMPDHWSWVPVAQVAGGTAAAASTRLAQSSGAVPVTSAGRLSHTSTPCAGSRPLLVRVTW